MKLADSIQSLPARVANYAKPRPETAGDLDEPIPTSGALAGGIQGYVATGLVGGVGGAIGGYVGIKAGAASGSLPVALGAGAAAGAASSTILGLGLLAVLSPQLSQAVNIGTTTLALAGAGAVAGAVYNATRKIDPELLAPKVAEKAPTSGVSAGEAALLRAGGFKVIPNPVLSPQGGSVQPKADETPAPTVSAGAIRARRAVEGLVIGAGATVIASGLVQVAQAVGPSHLIGPALLGGFIGAVGTLSGDRRAAVRDGVYGGMIAGGAAAIITGNPLLVVAGAAGAGIAGRAVKPAGRVVLGALAGAAAGAVAGSMGGPQGMLTGAIAGSLIAPTGALVGPVVRQVMRNLTVDASTAAINKIDPFLKKHPLSHSQKLMLGASMGAISLGTIGRVAGWTGAGVAAGVGAVGGAIQTERVLRNRAKEAEKQEFLQQAAHIAFGNRLDLETLTPTAPTAAPTAAA